MTQLVLSPHQTKPYMPVINKPISIRHHELASARRQKDRAIERAQQKGRLRRAAIRLMEGREVNKKLLYTLNHQRTTRAIDPATRGAYLACYQRLSATSKH